MARPNKVWKRKGTDWYYAKIGGKKVRLSQDRDEAETLMHQLLGEEKKDEPVSNTKIFPTFRKLADRFIDNSVRVNKPVTIRMHKMFLQSFCDHVKKRRVNDLKVHHVTEWIAATGWGQSTACSGRSTVLACLNWAVEQGYISGHPLGKLKRGSHKRRERVFSAEELKTIRDNVKPDFADFLRALELTGARPFSELALVVASAEGWTDKKRQPGVVDWATETVTFGEHKNEGKGKTRTIYLVPELVEMLKRLASKYPTGLLFRNSRGKVWTSHDATRRLHYVTDKLKIPRGTIYAVRHHVITKALEKGLNANVIAELVGNSPVTISRHYDHLSKQKESMKAAARKVVG